MGVFDAPTWVLAAWRRSLQDVGATADQATLEAYGERMIERWSAPERIHHNLRRLIAVLARVDELAPETHDPDVVRLAAWYHGAVFNAAAQHAYAHRGGVDEPASAELARSELTELGVPGRVVERIAALILGIARHSAPKDDIDAQALCDADLGGLAAEPQRYAAYRKEVRAEYAHIPREDYLRARLAIVTKLLGRRHLFQSPMAQDWEDAARENLTAELDRLTAEAHRLGAVGAPGGAEGAADGGAPVGTAAAPAAGGGQATADGGAHLSRAVAGADGVREAPARPSERTPAVPEEVDLPDGGPGPSGFEPRAAEEPGAGDRASGGGAANTGPERTGGNETGDRGAGDGQAEPTGASIEDAPVDGAGDKRAAAEDGRLGDDVADRRTAGAERPDDEPDAARPETVAQRSQRRWAEHLARQAAEQEAARTGAGALRRRDASAASPVEPRPADVGSNDGAEDAAREDLDASSSLSRPPRMPAVKPRQPEAERRGPAADDAPEEEHPGDVAPDRD